MTYHQFLLLMLLIFAACETDPVEMGEVTLAFDDLVQVNEDLQLGFDEVNDSRCPAEVVCVWEGEVTATLSASWQGQDSVILVCLGNRAECQATAQIGPYHITLIDANPVPIDTNPIPPQDYILTLSVDL